MNKTKMKRLGDEIELARRWERIQRLREAVEAEWAREARADAPRLRDVLRDVSNMLLDEVRELENRGMEVLPPTPPEFSDVRAWFEEILFIEGRAPDTTSELVSGA
jgi:hypothetical protein